MAAIEIRMPELSSDLTEADLISWLVAPGDEVEKGDLIAEIETDKATMEYESPHAGVVRELSVAEGTTVQVGDLLAVLDPPTSGTANRSSNAAAAAPPPAPSADAQQDRPDRPKAEKASSGAAGPSSSDASPAAAPTTKTDRERPPASALARRIAEQRGLDLGAVDGTGSHGRIVKADVLAAAPDASRTARTSASLFRVEATCDAAALLDLEAHFSADGGPASRRLHVAVRAAALAARDAASSDPAAEVNGALDIVAVASGRSQRIANAADQGLAQIAASIEASEDDGVATEGAGAIAVITVAAEGVGRIAPPIPPGCLAAIGLGAIEPTAIVRGGEVVAAHVVHCSLVADADTFDPEKAASLLAAFRRRIEDPLSMIL